MKRHVDVLTLGPPVFDQDIGNALGNFALLFRRTSLHPGNLHMRHRFPPTNAISAFYPSRCLSLASALSLLKSSRGRNRRGGSPMGLRGDGAGPDDFEGSFAAD